MVEEPFKEGGGILIDLYGRGEEKLSGAVKRYMAPFAVKTYKVLRYTD